MNIPVTYSYFHVSSTSFLFVCSKEYKKDVLYPVLVSVARRYGQADMYEGMVSDSEQLIIPKGATEMEIRVRQVGLRFGIDSKYKHMIYI